MNRRNFLKVMGAGVGAAFVGAEVLEALAAPDLPAPLRDPALNEARDSVAHVLNRVTFGPRPGQVDAVKKMGLQAYLDQQLNPAAINDDAIEKRLGDYITLDMTSAEIIAFGNLGEGEAMNELKSATLMRAVSSERQLFEVMVGFWSDHFSIWHPKEQCKILKTADDRDVIRKYALGKFRDLLGASAKSPAMGIFLDNAKSNKQHPNENYARELMELHTLRPGNYTETDVKEVARCFTGWSIQTQKDPQPGDFMFRPGIHDNGEKTVLGQKIPANGGIADGEIVLDMLAAHPATAKFIATKLCRRFIGDNPPDSAVKAAADVFLTSGGDIPRVLRTIFASPEFLDAPPKFKRPFEYMASLFRALDAQLDIVPILGKGNKKDQGLVPLGVLKNLGHLPFDHETPEGYSDRSASWTSNMLQRWNLAILTVYGVMPGAKVNITDLITSQSVPLTPRAILDYFAQHLLSRPLTQQESDAIWQFVSKKGEPNLTTDAGRKRLGDALAILAASPAYQYR